MVRFTRAENHLTLEQVSEKIKTSKDERNLKRWQIVYHTLLQPGNAKDIAARAGVCKNLVQKIIASYNREGEKAVEIRNWGGHRKKYLSIEEEKEFLAPFWKLAEQGKLTKKKEIQQAYEELIGRHVHKTTIYQLLERHGWQKNFWVYSI